MHCSRCYSLMAKDHLLVFEGATGRMWMDGYRCMNCGHVHESPTQQYHLSRREPISAHPRNESEYQGDDVHLGAESFVMQAA
ncbi:MAG: hypothetical protein Q8L77_10595 [Nitrospirota bacterium]|nr:hypothetical protein [Nitrospirota bacterium]